MSPKDLNREVTQKISLPTLTDPLIPALCPVCVTDGAAVVLSVCLIAVTGCPRWCILLPSRFGGDSWTVIFSVKSVDNRRDRLVGAGIAIPQTCVQCTPVLSLKAVYDLVFTSALVYGHQKITCSLYIALATIHLVLAAM